jgi:hypothetical protein
MIITNYSTGQFSICLFFLSTLIFNPLVNSVYSAGITGKFPIVKDPNLKVEQIGRGLADSPTSMDFLDKDHILVLEK